MLPQADTEALYANINSAYDVEAEKRSILKQPFRVEVEKTEVVANYRVYYKGVSIANGVLLLSILNA